MSKITDKMGGKGKCNVIAFGGSFLKKIFPKEGGAPNIRYYRVTNLQELYDGRRRDLLQNILYDMPKHVTNKTKFLLNVTNNSLYFNQYIANPKNHNPVAEIPFDPQKLDTFPLLLRRFLTFLIRLLKRNDVKVDELGERIVFLPNHPRFVFECCKKHPRADHKKNDEKVKNLIRTEIEYWQKEGVNIIVQKPLSDWLAFVLPELNLVEILEKSDGIKKWFLKKKTTFARKRVLKHHGFVRLILKEIMASQDNGLHIAPDYTQAWRKYIESYLTPNANPMPKARIKINQTYDFFRP
jgi:hypothetical protein